MIDYQALIVPDFIYSPYYSPQTKNLYISQVNVSLKLDNSHLGKEKPLFVRLRMKNSSGRYTESSISTEIKLLPKHFKNNGISKSTPNYTSKNKIINSIVDDIYNIIGEISENGDLPNPSLVKHIYLENKETKKITTPIYKGFWSTYDEYYSSKKHNSRGYTKTLVTLKNHLSDFQMDSKRSITFEYIIGKPHLFQSQFQDFLWTKKGLSNGYINKLYDNLSNFLYWSQQMGYIKKKPKFNKLSVVDRDEKIYLRTNEIYKLFSSKKWDYQSLKDDVTNPHIVLLNQSLKGTRKDEFDGVLTVTNWELVKDIFLFMSSVGCRHSDIQHFKVRHFDFDSEVQTLTWIQQKTNKNVSVPVTDISGSIFKKYSGGKSLEQLLFPKYSQQKFNKHLKYLLRDLKFNRIVSHPKMRGSKIIENDDRQLWELISSHSGRRSFIKNLIDMGEMDYKSIMKLSGHKSYTEFLKYVSVNKEDLKKGSQLYRLKSKDEEEELEEIFKTLTSLPKEKRQLVLQMIRSLK